MSRESYLNNHVESLPYSRKVMTCDQEDSMTSVIDTMQQNRIGSVVVVEGEKPIGIFTERDFLVKIGVNPIDFDSTTIGQFMTADPVAVTQTDTIFKVLFKMRAGRYRHMLVVDDRGDLEGVISIKDIMDYVVDQQNG